MVKLTQSMNVFVAVCGMLVDGHHICHRKYHQTHSCQITTKL